MAVFTSPVANVIFSKLKTFSCNSHPKFSKLTPLHCYLEKKQQKMDHLFFQLCSNNFKYFDISVVWGIIGYKYSLYNEIIILSMAKRMNTSLSTRFCCLCVRQTFSSTNLQKIPELQEALAGATPALPRLHLLLLGAKTYVSKTGCRCFFRKHPRCLPDCPGAFPTKPKWEIMSAVVEPAWLVTYQGWWSHIPWYTLSCSDGSVCPWHGRAEDLKWKLE